MMPFLKPLATLKKMITIYDLIARMEDKLVGSDLSAFSSQYMKKKLQEVYGDRIIISEINGKPNVVTFRSTAKAVLQDFYQQEKKKADPDVEKIRVVETAAKLIRNDIKMIEVSNTAYPTSEEIASEDSCINFLPDTLRVLLEKLIVGKQIVAIITSLLPLSLLIFSLFRVSSQEKNCINWTGYYTGSASTCVISTIANWIGCSIAPSLCIALSR